MKALVVLSLLVLSQNPAWAQSDPAKTNSLVYDPQTKKYFIGGNAKFLLKQNESSGHVDRIEVSIDGGPYRPYDEAVTFKEEGKHSLKFRANGSVNNWSPVQFIEVFVDLNAPTTEAKFVEEGFIKNPDKYLVSLNSSLSLVSQDNLSGVASVEYSWDGKNFLPYTKPVKFDKRGMHSFYYRGSDRVGNFEEPRKMDILVDATAPQSNVELVGNSKPAVINQKTFISDSMAFEIKAADDEAGIKNVWVKIDSQTPTLYIKPLYFLQEGNHTLTYYAEDMVGNKEKEKSLAFYTVSIPPRTQAIAVGKIVNTGGINYATRDFQLKLEATNNAVGLDRVEFKVDDESDFKTYLAPIRFDKLGMHTIYYQSVDRAGNFEPTRSFVVNLHEVPPETTLSLAQPLIERDGASYSPSPNIMTLNVGNSAVGIEQTYVSINTDNFKPYTGPITLSADVKTYKISYKSRDKLGNEETPKTVTYHMISSVPIVDLFISNGQSSEEKIRTNYLEGTAPAEAKKPVAPRVPAQQKPVAPTQPAKPAAQTAPAQQPAAQQAPATQQ